MHAFAEESAPICFGTWSEVHVACSGSLQSFKCADGDMGGLPMPAALCIQQCESGLLLLPRMQPMGRSCFTVCEAHIMDSKPWSVEFPAVSHASCSCLERTRQDRVTAA